MDKFHKSIEILVWNFPVRRQIFLSTVNCLHFVAYCQLTFTPGTLDFGDPDCAWYVQLPQGFSCGIASEPITECDGFGDFERFTPIPCDEIVLKVAVNDCEEGKNQSDCFAKTKQWKA